MVSGDYWDRRRVAAASLGVLALVWGAAAAEENLRTVPLMLATSEDGREGFVRVINQSDTAGEVMIYARDDAGTEQGPVVLTLAAGRNQGFTAGHLVSGDPDKGLSGSLGPGQGDWRLRMETPLDIEVMAYVRTSDGFVTSMHDVVPAEGLCWRVPFFNPGSNWRQRSLLRLANPNDRPVRVEVNGLDDRNNLPGSVVGFEVPPLAAGTISAQALEDGADGLTGGLGDGSGKWQLAVTADAPLTVMSLLETPTGHLANLSRPASYSGGRCWAATELIGADRSISRYLNELIAQDVSPGLIAAIVDSDGVRAIAAEGVRKAGAAAVMQETDAIHIGSNTKAMTSVMLATLVADGTFAAGWETTVADVFPELLGQIHVDHHGVTLRELVSMTSGIKEGADWHAHWTPSIVDQRYAILRDELAAPPAGPAGEFLYSNLGYMVAGAMAERRTGKSWETLMRERLFHPLGMSSAGFGPPATTGQVDQPWGHQPDPDTGSWVPGQLDDPAAGPAGMVHLSIVDWARFIALWLPAKPPAILDRETLHLLRTPVSHDYEHEMDYASGWYVTQGDWAGGVAIHHDGTKGDWGTLLVVAPGIGRAFLAGANSHEGETPDLLKSIIEQLISHVP